MVAKSYMNKLCFWESFAAWILGLVNYHFSYLLERALSKFSWWLLGKFFIVVDPIAGTGLIISAKLFFNLSWKNRLVIFLLNEVLVLDGVLHVVGLLGVVGNIWISLFLGRELLLLFLLVDIHDVFLHFVFRQGNVRLLFSLLDFTLESFTWQVLVILVLVLSEEEGIFAGWVSLFNCLFLVWLLLFNFYHFLVVKGNFDNVLKFFFKLPLSPLILAVHILLILLQFLLFLRLLNCSEVLFFLERYFSDLIVVSIVDFEVDKFGRL